VTSGTEVELDAHEQQQRLLFQLLDRQVSVRALDALVAAIRPPASTIALEHTAIGIDANVFLRLGNHARVADIVDYLAERHLAPLILPGQAIQEFWNNQLQAVDTLTSGLKKKFDGVKADFSKVDKNFGDYATQIEGLLEKFSAEHGHVYEEGAVRKTLNLLEMLQKRAKVPFVHRLRFDVIAAQRKRTKTPPGFKDDGDGDFFIWADFLKGLLEARDEKQDFERVVLVSLDKKLDWSRAGIPHPILVAEVEALLAVPFEIWSIDDLAKQISDVA